MDKVMLIYPPGRMFQRGEDRCQSNTDESAAASMHACNDLGYAAAILLNKHYEVFLRDYQTENASFDDVVNDTKKFTPDMILISVTNGTVLEDIDFVKKLYAVYPCKFVLKGAVFFDTDDELLSTDGLDKVACLTGGEIDTVIGDIADMLLRETKKPEDINDIIYKKDGKFIKTPCGCFCDDLDSIPFPARQLMNNSLYVRPDNGEPMATIQVSRGCPSQCIYCLTPIISGTKVRFRSPENVFAEIEECYYKFNIRNFFFKADTFTINSEWACRLCDMIINSPLHGKIEFTANSRTKPLDPVLLKKMKKAGCFMIAVGFESGNDETMKRIKKGATVEDNLKAAKMIKEAGLPLFGFFMIGFPWETEEMMNDTKKLIFEIDPDFVELHVAMPYLGTGLYDECMKYDTVIKGAWGSDYYTPNTKGTAFVPSERLQKLKSRYLLEFYLRPNYIMKKFLLCVKQPSTLGNYAHYAIRLVKNNLFKKKK